MSGVTFPERIAVLAGGRSAERSVSLASGEAVARDLAAAGFAVERLDPGADRWWSALDRTDFVFNVLHGVGGEDGLVQGFLETRGVPYSGSGVLGSALAMDKFRSKAVWQSQGLPTPACRLLTETDDAAEVLAALGPVFVKPTREGSSIGMARADDEEALERARRVAAACGAEVLAESAVEGPEYTVAVLGGECLPAIRLEPETPFYDYRAKYESGKTRYHIPCGLDPEREAALGSLCLAAFEALRCEVWGRVDVMLDPRTGFQLLEVNTVPGMTSHSLVPMAARAAGLDGPALLRRIIDLSLELRS